MATIDQLLNLGLAHGADTTRHRTGFVQSSPDPDALRWEHVHQALVGLDVEQRAALCLPCASHLVSAAELAALAYSLHVHLIAGLKPIDPLRAYPEIQARIIRTALAEHVDPKVCRSCKGAGKGLVHVEGEGVKVAACPKCAGRGWREWSDNRRAREVAVRRGDWLPHYAPAYEAVTDRVRSHRRAGERLLRERLFGSGDSNPEFDGLEARLQQGT